MQSTLHEDAAFLLVFYTTNGKKIIDYPFFDTFVSNGDSLFWKYVLENEVMQSMITSKEI